MPKANSITEKTIELAELMGWSIQPGSPVHYYYDAYISGGLVYHYEDGRHKLWMPFTLISDAWMVKQRMKELGYNFHISDEVGEEAYVKFVPHNVFASDGGGLAAYAPTAQVAICEAALKAKYVRGGKRYCPHCNGELDENNTE